MQAPDVTRRVAVPELSPRPDRRPSLLRSLLGGYLPVAVATVVVVLPLAWMALSSFKRPGEIVHLPIWWGPEQYAMAAAFALGSCLAAAYLPARKAGRVHPVDILRGAT